jgi:hypothetical protein
MCHIGRVYAPTANFSQREDLNAFSRREAYIRFRPHSRLGHCADKIRASQQHDPYIPLFPCTICERLLREERETKCTIYGPDPSTNTVYLMVKMVEHDRCSLILLVVRLPRIDHQGRASLLGGNGAHSQSKKDDSEAQW